MEKIKRYEDALDALQEVYNELSHIGPWNLDKRRNALLSRIKRILKKNRRKV